MTDTEVEVAAPSPVPTSNEYVGCFSDMVGDRVLTTVTTNEAMTLEVSILFRTERWLLSTWAAAYVIM